MNRIIHIADRKVGEKFPCFIIAEMSGNHNMDYDRAVEIVRAAKRAGADAIKLQTYTADTITLDSDKEYFKTGHIWEGTTLHKLYQQAYTPWEWQPELKKVADDLGIVLFSSPFDDTAVDFLEQMNVPAYKIASYEIVDIPLIRKVAQTGKPIMISTGIADKEDIELAVKTCNEEGNDNVILLKCTSEYPAPYEDMNLRTIPLMQDAFSCCCGLSDHSMGDELAIAAVAMGAKVIEKHFTLKRSDGGVDSSFSMEETEFAQMVARIRNVEKAMGIATFDLSQKQQEEQKGGRSLFICKDIKQGEVFTKENIRSVRPGYGLHTKYYDQIIGKHAARDLEFAEPLHMKDVKENIQG